MNRFWLVGVAAVALSACSAVEPVGNLDNLDSVNTTLPTDDLDAGDNSTAAADASAARIELTATGLLIVPSDGTPPEPLNFGASREAVVAAMDPLLGKGAEGDDCEVAPLKSVRYPGIDLTFGEVGFAGWTVDPDAGDKALKTASGIGIGSTRAALDAAYKPQVAESSLGLEFNVDALDGILSSDKPDATVTNLWAGETCVAR